MYSVVVHKLLAGFLVAPWQLVPSVLPLWAGNRGLLVGSGTAWVASVLRGLVWYGGSLSFRLRVIAFAMVMGSRPCLLVGRL